MLRAPPGSFDAPDSFGLQTAETVSQQFSLNPECVAIAMAAVSSVGLMVAASWRDEHHAGFGYRANARDWRAQGNRSAPERHHVAVPDRSRDAHRLWWTRRSFNRLVTDFPVAFVTVVCTARAPIGGFVASVAIWHDSSVMAGVEGSVDFDPIESLRYE